MADISYIDLASIGFIEYNHNKIRQYPTIIFTLDKPEQANARLKIANYILNKLQDEVEGWLLSPYCTSEIICLTKIELLNFRSKIQMPILQKS